MPPLFTEKVDEMLRAEYEARVRGITQTEIGKKCGVTSSLINRVIRGMEKPYPKLQQGIAAAIGWDKDPAELFQEIEVK